MTVAAPRAAGGATPRTALRRVAVVACLDVGPDPAGLLGLRREEAHDIRNGGGVLTDDELRSLAVSQQVLGTTEIALIRCDAAAVEASVRRIAASPHIPHVDAVRGYVYDPVTGDLSGC